MGALSDTTFSHAMRKTGYFASRGCRACHATPCKRSHSIAWLQTTQKTTHITPSNRSQKRTQQTSQPRDEKNGLFRVAWLDDLPRNAMSPVTQHRVTECERLHQAFRLSVAAERSHAT